MRSDTLDRFLFELAARVPAPGGCATAGLHLAQAAALLGMAARHTEGPEIVVAVRNRADELRVTGLGLAEVDTGPAVAEAQRLPGGTPEAAVVRTAALQQARLAAGRVPARVIRAASEVIGLAGRFRPFADPAVVSDVGASADAARAAAGTARLGVEAILTGITDPLARAELVAALDGVDELLARADRVTARVREQLRPGRPG